MIWIYHMAGQTMGTPRYYESKLSQFKILKYRVKPSIPGEPEKDNDFCFLVTYSVTACSGTIHSSFSEALNELSHIESEYQDALIRNQKKQENGGFQRKIEDILKFSDLEDLERTLEEAGVLSKKEVDYDPQQAIQKEKVKKLTEKPNNEKIHENTPSISSIPKSKSK